MNHHTSVEQQIDDALSSAISMAVHPHNNRPGPYPPGRTQGNYILAVFTPP
jgi:hypothetical protein